MKIDFLFNSHLSYSDDFLSCLGSKLSNVKYSDADLLVYEKNNMQVTIDDLATVYISKDIQNITELDKELQLVLDEYNRLSLVDKRFNVYTPLKILIPKSTKYDITKLSISYSYSIQEIKDSYALFLYTH
jgi:hypothetical protein